MISEQRELLDEILVKMRVGRMKRRTFLERAAIIGLGSAAAFSLLESCSGPGDVENIIWQSEYDSTNTYAQLVETYNQTQGRENGIYVTWLQGPDRDNTLLTRYTTTLSARSNTFDILSLDITYPAQFGEAKWIVPITEDMWPLSERKLHVRGPINGCTYKGKLWAVPYRIDPGVFFYRTDIVKSPPHSYDEMLDLSRKHVPAKAKYGYVWQGGQNEDLVCNFVEVLHGFGGAVLDNGSNVSINSPQALAALQTMTNWIETLSPSRVTDYSSESARLSWQRGEAVFMRNWPEVYFLANDATVSTVEGKFDIAPLPHGKDRQVSHSTLGGWSLAMNAFSTKSKASWDFVHWMAQHEAQKQGAINAGWMPCLTGLYDDFDLTHKSPLFGKLKPILQDALPRPVSPRYTELSAVLRNHVFGVLKGWEKPQDALKKMEHDLRALQP